MKVFIGLSKYGFFVIGQAQEMIEGTAKLSNIARLYEVQGQDGRIALQFHPDPYFMVDDISSVNLSDFVMYRVSEDEIGKVNKDYQEFLSKVSLQKSGLIAAGMNPAQARKIIQEGAY